MRYTCQRYRGGQGLAAIIHIGVIPALVPIERSYLVGVGVLADTVVVCSKAFIGVFR